MAYRKSHRRKSRYPKVVPVWTSTHTDAVTLAFQALLSKLGVNDIPSYLRQFRIPIAISAIVCACIGAATYGVSGFILGGLAGLLAPAVLLWVGVLLVGIAIYLVIFIAVWAVILYLLWWLLHQ